MPLHHLLRKWSPSPIGGGLALLFAAFTILWFATLPPPLPSAQQVQARWSPSEAWLHDREGALIDSVRVDFETRRLAWVPLADTAPALSETLIAAEDKRFRDHGGVDWLAVADALRDRFQGERARGASTLTMQLAGLLAPELGRGGGRGLLAKARQMRAAWAIEAGWSKNAILEAYLNLAGWRGENQGVGAAALSLFGKAPARLTRQDALLLVALLPDPDAVPEAVARRACGLARSYAPTDSPPALAGGVGGGSSSVASTIEEVEEPPPAPPRRRGGEQDCNALQASAATMLGGARAKKLDPGLAPHLAQRLLTKPGTRAATTLDANIQRIATRALSRQLRALGPERARDGAVVVVDNASGDVLAYVGGVGGGSTASQVDGASAYRQAGSTLKPFLYAQAMERGFLTPASILDDSPVQLDTASGLYVPQNYDRDFKGPVSVRTALAGSLNVPAVRTLLLAGVQPFRDRLWDAGYRGLTEDGQYYGFSLALGSAEVTLMEQAAAYRALALGGLWSPLRLTDTDARVAARRVFGAEAAWLVADILSDANARAPAFGLDSALGLPFWAAVKTGTSKAMRDNWCVGFSDRFTVAVWVGNLEGDSMRAVSGTSGAAPVWRDVMIALHAGAPGRAPAAPRGIERRAIAFAEGIEPPRAEFFLAGTAQALIGTAPAGARRPRIIDPVAGSVYALDPDIPIDGQRLGVSVAGQAAGHRLTLDARDLGPADARPLVLAGPGMHRLKLIDSGGRVVDSLRFTVR